MSRDIHPRNLQDSSRPYPYSFRFSAAARARHGQCLGKLHFKPLNLELHPLKTKLLLLFTTLFALVFELAFCKRQNPICLPDTYYPLAISIILLPRFPAPFFSRASFFLHALLAFNFAHLT
jgi:hypothetical protein